MIGRWLAASLALLACLLAAPAAQARRFALIVGNDVGHATEQPLQYAGADARRMGELLVQLARFEPADSVVLTGFSAADVQRGLLELSNRMRAEPGEHLFFFYFSGHADASGLHLGPTSFSFPDLKRELLDVPAAVRVAVVDACQSGALTRAKGGRATAAFQVTDFDSSPSGLAILASTSETEFAQESDALGGSFFTHAFEAGLRGLADRDRDGQVTLAEAFDYASERTLHATLGSAAGPQHPTYRYDLSGRQGVVLSYPGSRGARYGNVAFNRPGWYFVESDRGTLVLELNSRGAELVALAAGRYEIKRRDDSAIETALLDLASGERVVVSELPTTRVAFGRAVRKGGEVPGPAFALSLGGLVRTPVASLGPAAGLSAALRVDGAWASLELRAAFARAVSSTTFPATTWDTGTALAALHAWDFSAFTLAAGAEAGWALFVQELNEAPARVSHAAMLGPTLLAEVPWGERLCARLDLALPIYGLELEENGQRGLAWRAGVRAGLAAGGYF